MTTSKTSPIRDIEQEFSGTKFRDSRLKERLLQVAAAMANAPDASFPKAVKSSAELEGMYRLLGNTKVTSDEVLRPHVEQTLSRIADLPEVLVAHDSSTVSVTSEGHCEGLTPNRGEKQSFLLHRSLALRADGTRRPEGVLGASYHVPTDATNGELQQRWAAQV